MRSSHVTADPRPTPFRPKLHVRLRLKYGNLKLSLRQERARWARRHIHRRRIAAISRWVGGIAALGLVVLLSVAGVRLVWPPAWYLAQHPGPASVAINDYRLATGPVFVGLIQLLGGAIVVLGLWFSWLQIKLSREQHFHDLLYRAVHDLGGHEELTQRGHF